HTRPKFMNDCVFCRILDRQLPAEIIYENSDAICILDVHPIHFGHSLVIPRRHCADFLDLPPESYAGILDAASAVARATVHSLGLQGFNIFSNNGRIAGQSVFHFHLHVTPRYPDDNIRFVLELKTYKDGEMAEYANRIRRHIHHSS
ncbi:MAG: HIT domain-containing protein, partial [Bacteroidota bacterium]